MKPRVIRFGTIGTSSICEKMISCIKTNDNLKVSCCYSRDKERAREFILKNDIKAKAVDSFQVMLNEVDAVYIASPNGLHFEQALYFLTQQKHVLLEKPLTLDFKQALQLYEVAKKNQVILMEAFKILHIPNYSLLDDFVKKYTPFAANFSLNRYSSRMKDVKNGIYNSVFDEKIGKGSTYDMLVYPVELAISLFGSVKKVNATNKRLPNGVCYANSVILNHESGVLTTIMCSKSSTGLVGSEILSDEGTISFKELLEINEIKLFDLEENKMYDLGVKQDKDAMCYELDVFIKNILLENFELSDYLLKISCETVRVLNLIEKF